MKTRLFYALAFGLLFLSPISRAAPSTLHYLGDTITFRDSEWIVLDYKKRGKVLKNEFETKKTEGIFVYVKFKVKNISKASDSILETPRIVDAADNEYQEMDSASTFLPDGEEAMLLENLPPRVFKTFSAIYEVPGDIKSPKFRVRSLSILTDYANVELSKRPEGEPAPLVSSIKPTTPPANAKSSSEAMIESANKLLTTVGCGNVLHLVGLAVAEWSLDKHKAESDEVDINGMKPYLKGDIRCPAGGNLSVSIVSESPKCSMHGDCKLTKDLTENQPLRDLLGNEWQGEPRLAKIKLRAGSAICNNNKEQLESAAIVEADNKPSLALKDLAKDFDGGAVPKCPLGGAYTLTKTAEGYAVKCTHKQ